MVYLTVRLEVVDPLRDTLNVPVFPPLSLADESVAEIDTTGIVDVVVDVTCTKQSLLFTDPLALLIVSRPSETVIVFVASMKCFDDDSVPSTTITFSAVNRIVLSVYIGSPPTMRTL